ncbi:hypothetical protein NEPAR06_0928 [Nematocida parisii]|uniref:Uncharacterized protein n=1 Tax=Nematocida parisii (strain ERTm3) TaxID=935791 RepID=I3EDR6_NEMP3|nr:hypothetical protein NEQG_02486 [Nematocida parisii ERTm3]KAI5145617.1 hypothetical protein NEPAR07_1817 [Nematocida parisii]KAI5154164.1 hypothetical protein NEPAR06_0928 [Nematocida parisii]KAI5157174.1 hypothetical protein NEPAR05_1077 [Nematocida parisii]
MVIGSKKRNFGLLIIIVYMACVMCVYTIGDCICIEGASNGYLLKQNIGGLTGGAALSAQMMAPLAIQLQSDGGAAQQMGEACPCAAAQSGGGGLEIGGISGNMVAQYVPIAAPPAVARVVTPPVVAQPMQYVQAVKATPVVQVAAAGYDGASAASANMPLIQAVQLNKVKKSGLILKAAEAASLNSACQADRIAKAAMAVTEIGANEAKHAKQMAAIAQMAEMAHQENTQVAMKNYEIMQRLSSIQAAQATQAAQVAQAQAQATQVQAQAQAQAAQVQAQAQAQAAQAQIQAQVQAQAAQAQLQAQAAQAQLQQAAISVPISGGMLGGGGGLSISAIPSISVASPPKMTLMNIGSAIGGAIGGSIGGGGIGNISSARIDSPMVYGIISSGAAGSQCICPPLYEAAAQQGEAGAESGASTGFGAKLAAGLAAKIMMGITEQGASRSGANMLCVDQIKSAQNAANIQQQVAEGKLTFCLNEIGKSAALGSMISGNHMCYC